MAIPRAYQALNATPLALCLVKRMQTVTTATLVVAAAIGLATSPRIHFVGHRRKYCCRQEGRRRLSSPTVMCLLPNPQGSSHEQRYATLAFIQTATQTQ